MCSSAYVSLHFVSNGTSMNYEMTNTDIGAAAATDGVFT